MTKVEQILADLTYPNSKWQKPNLVATFGFPGAGKTTVATEISSHYPFIQLSTDALRLQYDFQTGLETLQHMYLVAEKLLTQNYGVLFDGIHLMKKNRAELRQFGKSHNTFVRFVHVVANPPAIKQRLQERVCNPEATVAQGKFVITDAHFQQIISFYENPQGEPDIFIVDTSSSNLPYETQLKSLYDDLDTCLPTSASK